MAILESDAAILPPSDDRVFKLLFTHPDAKPVLMDIISAVLDCKVLDVQVRNNELPPTDLEEKMERFDVNAVIDGGRQIDMEMQASSMEEKMSGEHINLRRKTIYYLSDLHSSQSSKGKAYDELARSYQVTFCSYTVFPQRTMFVNEFSMRTEDGYLFNDDIQVIFIELSKLNELLEKPVNEMTSLEMWSLFLRYADIPKYRYKVNEVIKAREVMGVATELLTTISQDERERAIFRSRRMYITDWESNIRTAELRGEERGIVIGEERGIVIGEERGITIGEERGIAIGEERGDIKLEERLKQIVAHMKQMGMPFDKIAIITGIPNEIINKM